MFTCSDCTSRSMCAPCAEDVFVSKDLDDRAEEAFAISAAQKAYAESEAHIYRGDK